MALVHPNAQYEKRSSDTDYNHNTDLFKSLGGLERAIRLSFSIEKLKAMRSATKLVLRPAKLAENRAHLSNHRTPIYSSKTDPAFDPFFVVRPFLRRPDFWTDVTAHKFMG
ncbi:MAG: hypothetical protein WDM76_19140 [Limisphaerales bacterium]